MVSPRSTGGELAAQGPPVLTVGELNRSARRLLEQSFALTWVAGEISNLTQAASGHLYFSLKDREAQVRCVMFRNRAALLGWAPANGLQVEVRAVVTLYEARGEFQLGVETVRRAGLGALYEAFARLKQKLEAEGLFAEARKRALPAYPRRVGIVTSLAAAALRDVLTTLAHRNPRIPLIIYPSLVQGDGAARQLAQALEAANRRAECDVLILCRGGGGIEDLWAYNDENLARAIAASRIPVISGVGHETDFTIADFVADARAPTPTAAAALAVPDRIELFAALANLARRLRADFGRLLQSRSQRVDQTALRLRHPGANIELQFQSLAQLRRRLALALPSRLHALILRTATARGRIARAAPRFTDMQRNLQRRFASVHQAIHAGQRLRGAQIRRVAASLVHLDPEAVLARGYSLVRGSDGAVLKDGAQLHSGDEVNIAFAQGWADARITRSGG
jgi:exodeoxyribonuclease VII large subunit